MGTRVDNGNQGGKWEPGWKMENGVEIENRMENGNRGYLDI